MNSARVFIATTEGPSEVQRILPEDPEVRSVVCLDGTSKALRISNAYDAFVRKPTGVIERHFDHAVFRMDVSHEISSGNSWQLGAFLAHALLAEGRLASAQDENGEEAILVTGTVNHNLAIGPVSHVEEKLRRADGLFAYLEARHIPLTVVLPAANARENGVAAMIDALEKDGIRRFVGVETVSDLCPVMALRLAGIPSASTRTALVQKPESLPVIERPRSSATGRIALLVLVLLMAGAGYGGWLTWKAGIEDWLKMSREGRYLDLYTGLRDAEDGGCLPCMVARQAYIMYANANRPEIGKLRLEATELRAPEGFTCTTVGFGRSMPVEHTIEQVDEATWKTSSGAGLCALEYRLRNDSPKPLHAWLAVARSAKPDGIADDDTVIKKGTVGPGSEISLHVKVPRWPRINATNHVLVIVAEADSTDIDRFLDQLVRLEPQRAKRAQRTMENTGISALYFDHEVVP